MSMDHSGPFDGANLAASVRELATHAHHLLQQPAPSDREAREITRTIRLLKQQLQDRSDNDLTRWLDSLRDEVETRVQVASSLPRNGSPRRGVPASTA